MAISNVLQEQINFLAGNNVADVFRVAEVAERQADHFVTDDRRAAAVAGVDGGINLNPQTGGGKIVFGKFDSRDDALGNGETAAAFWITVHHDSVFDFGQHLGAG